MKLYGGLRQLNATPRCDIQGATVREILDTLTRDNTRLRAAQPAYIETNAQRILRISRLGQTWRAANAALENVGSEQAAQFLNARRKNAKKIRGTTGARMLRQEGCANGPTSDIIH